jgi:hypothetical protein
MLLRALGTIEETMRKRRRSVGGSGGVGRGSNSQVATRGPIPRV